VNRFKFKAGRTEMATIAFIGLGNMGGPMAANLLKAGHRVTGFDLVEASRDAARANGVDVKSSGAAAVADADAVITMLLNGQMVLNVYAELAAMARRGTLFIDCSTIDVSSALGAHEIAADHDHASLDCPVTGGVSGARDGMLTLLAGGTAEAVARAEPLLEAVAERVVHCGPRGMGQAAKICNNLMLGISMLGVSEAFLLAERLGLSEQVLFDLSSSKSGLSRSLLKYLPVPGPVRSSPANHDFKPGFTSALMQKDLKLAQNEAQRTSTTTPLGTLAAQLYALHNTNGNASKDFSAIINMLRGTEKR
jgi:3-hydroxyisobutyrate dehydrogenase